MFLKLNNANFKHLKDLNLIFIDKYEKLKFKNEKSINNSF